MKPQLARSAARSLRLEPARTMRRGREPGGAAGGGRSGEAPPANCTPQYRKKVR